MKRKKAEHLRKHDFAQKGSEPLDKLVALRLSTKMFESIHNTTSNEISEWIREAIAEKLEKEIYQQAS